MRSRSSRWRLLLPGPETCPPCQRARRGGLKRDWIRQEINSPKHTGAHLTGRGSGCESRAPAARAQRPARPIGCGSRRQPSASFYRQQPRTACTIRDHEITSCACCAMPIVACLRKTIQRRADSGRQAVEVHEAAIAGTVTAARNGSGRLELISWRISPDGLQIQRLNDSGHEAGEATHINISQFTANRFVTALRAGNGKLKLIAFDSMVRAASGALGTAATKLATSAKLL